MLRAAREKQGLHIAALAAAIKVSPRKLEALEADRLSELPDATFTRALAQTMCRTLKIDARPVLELLPPAPSLMLRPIGGGLNAPFRERPGREDPGLAGAALRPMLWAPRCWSSPPRSSISCPRVCGSRSPRRPQKPGPRGGCACTEPRADARTRRSRRA